MGPCEGLAGNKESPAVRPGFGIVGKVSRVGRNPHHPQSRHKDFAMKGHSDCPGQAVGKTHIFHRLQNGLEGKCRQQPHQQDSFWF